MNKKCEICGKKAVYRFSPDLDISGIGACKKHKIDVHIAYIALVTQGEQEYNFIINEMKRSNKKKIKAK